MPQPQLEQHQDLVIEKPRERQFTQLKRFTVPIPTAVQEWFPGYSLLKFAVSYAHYDLSKDDAGGRPPHAKIMPSAIRVYKASGEPGTGEREFLLQLEGPSYDDGRNEKLHHYLREEVLAKLGTYLDDHVQNYTHRESV